MNSFMGMRIIVSPYVMKTQTVKIDPEFEWITPDCRSRINKWLLDTFGERESFFIIDNDKVMMSPAGYDDFRKVVESKNMLMSGF